MTNLAKIQHPTRLSTFAVFQSHSLFIVLIFKVKVCLSEVPSFILIQFQKNPNSKMFLFLN